MHSYEVWNWGTFDHHIYKIEPLGETSLLTGANASGKTTLIDGLLTLLVPERRMRFYNQTAGSKGERTEESYVLGEWGETENEESNTRESKKLRGEKEKAQTVLLAVFQSESQFVTLAQARWFSGGELKRTFVLAHKQLSIAADFMPFDSNGEWRRRLKKKYLKQGSKDPIYLTDSPVEYGRLMQTIFGMRSEKAHTLFSQTVGLKVLGDLNEFVRAQMLEKRAFEAEFQKIKKHFKTLNDAHRAIEKAHKQIELLNPIREKAIALSKHQADLLLQENCKEAAPLWFALKQESLAQEFLAEKTAEAKEVAEEEGMLKLEIGWLTTQERDLYIHIQNDEVSRQISDQEKIVKQLEKEKAEREKELSRYNKLASSLELVQNPSSKALFEEQRKEAQQQKEESVQVLEQLGDEVLSLNMRYKRQEEEFNKVSDELSLLRAQKNNITGAPARIRKEILKHLGITEKELPFIGELIKVRGDAREWEPAIERLLHNFAQRLLVPEEYYQQLNQYVHQHDLGGRLVYHRFNKKEVAPQLFYEHQEDKLVHKLEFRTTAFTEWVKSELIKSFDYSCTESLEDFRLSHKALLKSGLIKNASRHEKDDRPEIRSRQQYVLGWDTKEKVAVLREDAEKLRHELSQLDQQLKHLKNQGIRIEQKKDNLTRFLEFNQYQKIDWWSISVQIQEDQQKIEELQQTNDRAKTLKDQREAVLITIEKKQKELEAIFRKLHDVEHALGQQEQKLREAREVIDSYAGLELENSLARFETTFVSGHAMDITSIARLQRDTREQINTSIEEIKERIRLESSAAEGLMRAFTHPEKEIAEKFEDWSADTHRLRERVDFIDEYVALLVNLEEEGLTAYEQEFKKYLNEEMITEMSDFQSWLQQHEEDIEENIESLNESLGKINYKNSPPTFIKLQTRKDYSPKVKDFRFSLNNWKPNTLEYQRTQDDRILEESFTRIKLLLDTLTADEDLRKEVLDVRNWLRFEAKEIYREDPAKPGRTYTGTAKLSGGEGSQLTYTILCAAIAYQFGIHSEGLNPNSFRFICVDEAFSKQDDEKARFLMELCKQLHLQLMVVSPAKAEEVAIVEPYIARVHFVQRKDNRNSVVFDMPIKLLQENRHSYMEEAS